MSFQACFECGSCGLEESLVVCPECSEPYHSFCAGLTEEQLETHSSPEIVSPIPQQEPEVTLVSSILPEFTPTPMFESKFSTHKYPRSI